MKAEGGRRKAERCLKNFIVDFRLPLVGFCLPTASFILHRYHPAGDFSQTRIILSSEWIGGIFITFEGSDGCGKSTQIERLRAHLAGGGTRQRPVTFLREPGGTPLGEEIRRLLRRSAPDWSVSPESELLLFAASRAQLVRETILPALAGGGIVVCDRFLDSTTVYQGVARRLDPAVVEVINQFAAGERRPGRDLPARSVRRKSACCARTSGRVRCSCRPTAWNQEPARVLRSGPRRLPAAGGAASRTFRRARRRPARGRT